MLRLVDIKRAIAELIRQHWPESMVHFDHLDKAAMPYFYVEFTDVTQTTLDEVGLERRMQIDITYCPAPRRKSQRNDLYLMGDKLDLIFRPVLQIQDRYLTLQEAEIAVHDDVLHYIFELNFADAVEMEETYELMQKLAIDWR